MSKLGAHYLSLALKNAKERNLSAAATFSRRALLLNPDDEKARKLLGLCLYEMGSRKALDILSPFPEYTDKLSDAYLPDAFENLRMLSRRKKWLKAEALARKITHQSIRVLLLRGCFLAAARRYTKAAALFAAALEKDLGNKLTISLLTEASKRSSRAHFGLLRMFTAVSK